MIEQILAVLMALGLLAFGAFTGTQAFTLVREQWRAWDGARRSRTWPSTDGTIEENRLTWEGVRHPRAQPVIGYRYQVGGGSYLGKRIEFSFARVYFTPQAEAVLARYPAGAHVTVYYDPLHPAESTLEQRHSSVGEGLLLVLVLLLPTCLCLASGLTGMAQAFGH